MNPQRPVCAGNAAFASDPSRSRGRRVTEAPPEFRSEFQRDRDRIIHSAAFRRLEYKTQVFVNHEGDMFRTRLTHSIEVAQIARTIARALGLDEDLTEAIALAHDLGHTPFGHAGQDALNDCMREWGGFEHNLQALRVVDLLEERYAAFAGLNLCFETREGILKHCSRSHAVALGDVGRRFIEGGQPSLEAQVANIADEIAYNNHDVDDGLRAGLLEVESLREVSLFEQSHAEVSSAWPSLPQRRLVHEIVRRMVNRTVLALLEHSRETLAREAPADVTAVRAAARPMVGFGADSLAQQHELKRFLRENLYRHYRVHRMTRKAGRVLRALFGAFMDDSNLLPGEARRRVAELQAGHGTGGRARAVADYIAGMTDRFAFAEYGRVFHAADPG